MPEKIQAYMYHRDCSQNEVTRTYLSEVIAIQRKILESILENVTNVSQRSLSNGQKISYQPINYEITWKWPRYQLCVSYNKISTPYTRCYRAVILALNLLMTIWYGMVFKYLYSAPQQPCANRGVYEWFSGACLGVPCVFTHIHR